MSAKKRRLEVSAVSFAGTAWPALAALAGNSCRSPDSTELKSYSHPSS